MTLKFGDKVKITGTVVFRYPDKFSDEIQSNYKGKYVSSGLALEGIVLRKTRRATGTYYKATGGSWGEDWEPASLSIDKWHPVYEVSVSPHGRLSFVEEDQIEVIS